MDATIVYEIVRYEGEKADAALLDRLQLIAEDGVLRLRDANGNETACEETDISAVIASTPALRTAGSRQQARITCGDDIVGQLPLLLEPVPDGATLLVNDEMWDAFPTVEGGHVMLPGQYDYDCAPNMKPCWAEFSCAEGGRDFENQLTGYSSIGLLAPGVAIERGRTEYGGNGGAAAVAVWRFDDFASIFVDWLLRTEVLSGFWQGDRDISSPDVELFAEAAEDPEHEGYWEDADSSDEDEDDPEEDEGEDDHWGDQSFACASLELHLPQELIDQVRAYLAR